MKNIIKISAVLGLLALTSCDFFLQKPDTTGTVDRDAVFGTKKNAEAALMSCYSNALYARWSFTLKWYCAWLGKPIGAISF